MPRRVNPTHNRRGRRPDCPQKLLGIVAKMRVAEDLPIANGMIEAHFAADGRRIAAGMVLHRAPGDHHTHGQRHEQDGQRQFPPFLDDGFPIGQQQHARKVSARGMERKLIARDLQQHDAQPKTINDPHGCSLCRTN